MTTQIQLYDVACAYLRRYRAHSRADLALDYIVGRINDPTVDRDSLITIAKAMTDVLAEDDE